MIHAAWLQLHVKPLGYYDGLGGLPGYPNAVEDYDPAGHPCGPRTCVVNSHSLEMGGMRHPGRVLNVFWLSPGHVLSEFCFCPDYVLDLF